jgi:hypothetical protein
MQQWAIRHEMVEKLEHAQLEQITLHKRDVQWYKKGKEIILNSTLFDVHNFSIQQDSICFRGLYDYKETELKNQVIKLLNERNENNSSRNVNLVKFLMQVWLVNDKAILYPLHALLINDITQVMAPPNLLSADISIPFPPPKA